MREGADGVERGNHRWRVGAGRPVAQVGDGAARIWVWDPTYMVVCTDFKYWKTWKLKDLPEDVP